MSQAIKLNFDRLSVYNVSAKLNPTKCMKIVRCNREEKYYSMVNNNNIMLKFKSCVHVVACQRGGGNSNIYHNSIAKNFETSCS